MRKEGNNTEEQERRPECATKGKEMLCSRILYLGSLISRVGINLSAIV